MQVQLLGLNHSAFYLNAHSRFLQLPEEEADAFAAVHQGDDLRRQVIAFSDIHPRNRVVFTSKIADVSSIFLRFLRH